MFNCCVMYDWPNRAWFVLSGDRNEEMPHYETHLPNVMLGRHLNYDLYYKDDASSHKKANANETGKDKKKEAEKEKVS
jgi:hypothetical protein